MNIEIQWSKNTQGSHKEWTGVVILDIKLLIYGKKKKKKTVCYCCYRNEKQTSKELIIPSIHAKSI